MGFCECVSFGWASCLQGPSLPPHGIKLRKVLRSVQWTLRKTFLLIFPMLTTHQGLARPHAVHRTVENVMRMPSYG